MLYYTFSLQALPKIGTVNVRVFIAECVYVPLELKNSIIAIKKIEILKVYQILNLE